MAEPALTNLEEIMNFQQLKQKISCSGGSQFNGEALKMVEAMEKDWKIAVGTRDMQVVENFLLMFHGLINFRGTTRSDTSSTPRTLGDNRSSPVKKCDEAKPVNYIYVSHDEKSNGPVYPNANHMNGRNGIRDGGSERGFGNGDGGSDGRNAAMYPMFDLSRPIRIHRIQQPSNVRSPILYTTIFANHCGSWNALARAIYQAWLTLQEGGNDLNAPDPSMCWPGCCVDFGMLQDDTFYCYDWCEHPWETVKHLITDIVVKPEQGDVGYIMV